MADEDIKYNTTGTEVLGTDFMRLAGVDFPFCIEY